MSVFATFVFSFSFGQRLTANQEPCKRDTVLYYWHDYTMDEYSDLIPQDCYMELYFVNNKLEKGFFWGTTDEFDYGREGYECGYFVLPMTEIQQGMDSISFKLSPIKTEHGDCINTFVKAPINRHIRSWQEAVSRYQTWDCVSGMAFENDVLYSISFIQKNKTSNTSPIGDSMIVRKLTNCSCAKRKFKRIGSMND